MLPTVSHSGGGAVRIYARLALSFGIMLGAGSIIGAIFIMADDFGNTANGYESSYPGIAIILNAVFVFLSTWIMRYGTIPAY